MEKQIHIETSDDHIIYGTLNFALKDSDKLIIFVHGLSGHQNEHIFYNAARFFPQNGFSTFRFDLYSGESKGRILSKTSIKDHVQDLDTIIQHFKSQFKHIVLVGHSLGGRAW